MLKGCAITVDTTPALLLAGRTAGGHLDLPATRPAELPSLQLSDIHISDKLVNEHDRMLTGGFYAEVTL